MVDPEREATQRVPQLPCKQLELRRPLRAVLHHGHLAALIGKGHAATRYASFERPHRGRDHL